MGNVPIAGEPVSYPKREWADRTQFTTHPSKQSALPACRKLCHTARAGGVQFMSVQQLCATIPAMQFQPASSPSSHPNVPHAGACITVGSLLTHTLATISHRGLRGRPPVKEKRRAARGAGNNPYPPPPPPSSSQILCAAYQGGRQGGAAPLSISGGCRGAGPPAGKK